MNDSTLDHQTERYHDEKLSPMRKAIARVVTESKFSSPHSYMSISIDMKNAIAKRTILNDESSIKISFNDLVILAAVKSLKDVPEVNCVWGETHIRFNHHVNIGVAIATEKGLLIPVIKQAQIKSIEEISAEVKEFGGRAKVGKILPEETQNNTFTISNLGMLGIQKFTSILYQPSAAIMAVGSIRDEAAVLNGSIVPAKVMKVTISIDSRAISPMHAARFLSVFKDYLEYPDRMFRFNNQFI